MCVARRKLDGSLASRSSTEPKDMNTCPHAHSYALHFIMHACPTGSRAHGCTQTMLDCFQGRCNYHTGSADWLSLHTTTPLSYFERRFGKSIEQRYQQTLTRRIEQKSRYALYYSRAPCTFVNMACATEGCTCTFPVLASARGFTQAILECLRDQQQQSQRFSRQAVPASTPAMSRAQVN